MRVGVKGMVAALLGLLAATAARAQQPPELVDIMSRATSECRLTGGRSVALQGFETVLDLNRDGRLDHLLDFTRLRCEGARSPHCTAAGCQLVAVVSGPEGYAAEWLGPQQGWSLEQGQPLPVLVLALRGAACGRPSPEGCSQRIAWNGRQLVAIGRPGPLPPVPTPMPSPPGPRVTTGGGRVAPGTPSAPGSVWQVRRDSEGRPLAVVAGPGALRAVTVQCRLGVPLILVALRPRPAEGPVFITFTARSGRAELQFEPGPGQTWIADLGDARLARLLAGRDASMDVAINGGRQGWVSLSGSTRAVREALAPCQGM